MTRSSIREQVWLSLHRELDAEACFDLLGRDHFDGVPRAAVEEGAVRPLARALLAADRSVGVHFSAVEGRRVWGADPVRAVRAWAVGGAGGRGSAGARTI